MINKIKVNIFLIIGILLISFLFCAVAFGGQSLELWSFGVSATNPVGSSTGTSNFTASGRYIAFSSSASNIAAWDKNGAWDIFLYDRKTKTVQRVSINAATIEGNLHSYSPALSGDGQFIVFRSLASNLVLGDNNGKCDIFVYDRANATVKRVNVDNGGGQANQDASSPCINGDGQYVAFASAADNLVGGDTNNATDVFVYDLQTSTIERISKDNGGVEGDDSSDSPALSSDGAYIAFTSSATNLVADDTNGATDIFLWERAGGTVQRVSIDSGGTQANGPSSSPAVSADGKYIAFESDANNLVADDTNGATDVFVFDRDTGSIVRVSVNGGAGEGNANSGEPNISTTGQFVTFKSDADNLVSGDTNEVTDIFLTDWAAGTIQRTSLDSSENQADSSSYGAHVSPDGRYVTFVSLATNLVSNDLNGTWDVFIRDLQNGTTERTSFGYVTKPADGTSENAQISGNGRFIGYVSQASNLIFSDTNTKQDIFVHDRLTNVTKRISISNEGEEATLDSYRPRISYNNKYIAFDTASPNLVSDDTGSYSDVFVYAWGTDALEAVSRNNSGVLGNSNSTDASISTDGRLVAFVSTANNLVNPGANSTFVSDIFVYDQQNDTIEWVSPSTSGTEGNSNSSAPRISADGQFVTFQSAASNLVLGDTNGQIDIFVYERGPDLLERVSLSNLGAQANLSCENPDISSDGRFVAFESTSTSLVPGDTNSAKDIFVYDRNADTIERVSLNKYGQQGNGNSYAPRVSSDGRFVTFHSLAGNLVSNDTNGLEDVFVYDRQEGVITRTSLTIFGVQTNEVSVQPSISGSGGFVVFSSEEDLHPSFPNSVSDVFFTYDLQFPPAGTETMTPTATSTPPPATPTSTRTISSTYTITMTHTPSQLIVCSFAPFLDDFEDGNAQDGSPVTWDNPSAQWSVSAGSYRVITSDEKIWTSYAMGGTADDFILEFDVRLNDGLDRPVFFRMQDENNYYELNYNHADGWIYIYKVIGGSRTQLSSHNTLKSHLGEWQHIKLEVNNTTYSVELDYIDQFSGNGLTEFATGGIALAANTSGLLPTDIEFDNLDMYCELAPTSTPTPTTTSTATASTTPSATPTTTSTATASTTPSATPSATSTASPSVTVTHTAQDPTPPEFTAINIPPDSYINSSTAQICWENSEELSSGQIQFIAIGGAADPGSPHLYDLSGSELLAGTVCIDIPDCVSGAIYELIIVGCDLFPNCAAPLTVTNITVDYTLPACTGINWSDNSILGSGTTCTVQWTNSEDLSNCIITLDWIGGTPDPGGPHIFPGELLAGAHSTDICCLIDGALYNITIQQWDLAINYNITYIYGLLVDLSDPVFSDINPGDGGSFDSSTCPVTFTSSEDLSSCTVDLIWTSGAPDPTGTHTYTCSGSELFAGTQTVNIGGAISGATYMLIITGCDLYPHCADPVTITNILCIDAQPPLYLDIQPCGGCAFTSTTGTVSWTNSENMQSLTITVECTGGACVPGTQQVFDCNASCLSQGPHSVDFPGLIDGGIYKIIFDGCDFGANCAPLTVDNVLCDNGSAPVFDITFPTADHYFNTTTLIINYSVSETIANCTLTLECVSPACDPGCPHLYNSGPLPAGQHNYNFTNLMDGCEYRLIVAGCDLVPNCSAPLTITGLHCDLTGPEFTNVTPDPNSVIGSTTITVGWTITEVLLHYTIKLEWIGGAIDPAGPYEYNCNMSCGELAPGSYTHDFAGLVDGARYRLVIYACDPAGNCCVCVIVTNIRIDLTPPTFEPIIPATGEYFDPDSLLVTWVNSEILSYLKVSLVWTGGVIDIQTHEYICNTSCLSYGAQGHTFTNLIPGAIYKVVIYGCDLAPNCNTQDHLDITCRPYTPTSTPTATATATPTPTSTGTHTPTASPTPSPTSTGSVTPSVTPTNSPSVTLTDTATTTPTTSPTFTHTPTVTRTATLTTTKTTSPTHTATPSVTLTATPSATSTSSPTPTLTPTITPSATGTPSHTITLTATPSTTFTHTPTATPSASFTPTVTCDSRPAKLTVEVVVDPEKTDYITINVYADEPIDCASVFLVVVPHSASHAPTTISSMSKVDDTTCEGFYHRNQGFGDVKNIYAYATDNCGNTGSSDGTFKRKVISNKPVIISRNKIKPRHLGDSCTIRYQTAKSGQIEVKIYNKLGELIRTLAEGPAEAGKYEVSWDGRNTRGEIVASDLYFLVVQTSEYIYRDKIIVLK